MGRIGWRGRSGFFDVEERLAGLSKKGDDLERLAAVVDFELFRPELERAVPRADRSKGGRPPFDHVLMFKVLILQTQNNLSDERTEFYLRDRLTWMRFLGLGLGDAVPDANTIWTFREALTKAGAIERLFALFDQRAPGRRAISRCPGNWSTRASSRRPSSATRRAEKQAIKEGRVPEDWQAKPAKLRQKDRDARWTVKTTKAKPREGETPLVDLAIPEFGYQNHISADRRHRLIRRWLVTDAAAHAGARLADLLDPGNTARRRLGRHRLPLEEERGPAAPADAGEPHPPQEAARAGRCRSARARANARKSAVRAHDRARLRRAEGTGWACSCAPSAWLGRRPRSASPTSSTTCAACSGWNASRRSPDDPAAHPEAPATAPPKSTATDRLPGPARHRGPQPRPKLAVDGGVQLPRVLG